MNKPIPCVFCRQALYLKMDGGYICINKECRMYAKEKLDSEYRGEEDEKDKPAKTG